MNNAVETIAQFFQTLSPQRVEQLAAIYADDASFRDPFNQVRGLSEIQRIFRHMYVNLVSPRFIITDRIVDGQKCFLTWEFRFSFRRFQPAVEHCVLGGSHLLLDQQGRITMHCDYWDAAEGLYEKLPVVGVLMRWLKRRTST